MVSGNRFHDSDIMTSEADDMRCFQCGNFASVKVELRDDYEFKIRFYCAKCLKLFNKENQKWEIQTKPIENWKSV